MALYLSISSCIASQKSPAWDPGQHSSQDGEYSPIDSQTNTAWAENVKMPSPPSPTPLCSLCQSCDQPKLELNELCFMVGTEACFSRYTAGRWSALHWYGQVCPEGGPETLGQCSIAFAFGQTRDYITGLSLIWSNLLLASSLPWMSSLKVELLPRKRPWHIKLEGCAGGGGNGWAV